MGEQEKTVGFVYLASLLGERVEGSVQLVWCESALAPTSSV
jgi:hypothetical protein